MSFLPCGNTATCQKCCAWENYLHIERCWRGKSAQMVVVSGFGGADSTTAETTGLAKVLSRALGGPIKGKPRR